jgi:hypothetical protein
MLALNLLVPCHHLDLLLTVPAHELKLSTVITRAGLPLAFMNISRSHSIPYCTGWKLVSNYKQLLHYF